MATTSLFIPAPQSRRALSLIEMLVGMAITLVMMAAVVNLFANISTSVNNRQGAMEISSELRIARQRLYNDLAGATVKTDAVDSSDGYFEIVEGQASDENPRAGSSLILDQAVSLIPSSNRVSDVEGNLINPAVVTDFNALGDYDDILALTVESRGAPFRGRGRTLITGGNPAIPNNWIGTSIESRFAEVIWFAVENPADGSRGEPGMRNIYRRVLLIAPWVTTYDIPGGATGQSDPIFDLTNMSFHPNATTSFALRLSALLEFQDEYDISVRLEGDRLVPNTLADLARREHRFAHLTDDFTPTTGITYNYPHIFPYNINNTANKFNILPPGRDNGTNQVSSLQPLMGERAGSDIVLSNVLAFDVRSFDPGAPLFQDATGNLLEPGTPGWTYLATTFNPIPVGFGAYVDLYWRNIEPWDVAPVFGVWNTTVKDPPIHYGDVPTLHSQLNLVGAPSPPFLPYRTVTYDAWTDYYETDGVNQDQDYSDAGTTFNIDEGTNGLDDPDPTLTGNTLYVEPPGDFASNGPDDTLERETSPPYPTPLKGVQVKLRIYEPGSRAIREANVTRDMTE